GEGRAGRGPLEILHAEERSGLAAHLDAQELVERLDAHAHAGELRVELRGARIGQHRPQLRLDGGGARTGPLDGHAQAEPPGIAGAEQPNYALAEECQRDADHGGHGFRAGLPLSMHSRSANARGSRLTPSRPSAYDSLVKRPDP